MNYGNLHDIELKMKTLGIPSPEYELSQFCFCGDFYRKLAGSLLFVVAAQFLVAVIIAETLYPGYSASLNYTSDLGVGSNALIFNSSIFLFGLAVIVSSYYLQRFFQKPVDQHLGDRG